ncbi:MAG TPA: pyridoxal-dependent decarboxylase [Propionibacteriaceae bacterium]|nr:pyridoxal-dependent decarboxylase [Propionibacteriaceae bacterium]
MRPTVPQDGTRVTEACERAPFLVVATAGTTNAETIDPLPEFVDLCAAEGLRLYVDAAWPAPCPIGPAAARADRD